MSFPSGQRLTLAFEEEPDEVLIRVWSGQQTELGTAEPLEESRYDHPGKSLVLEGWGRAGAPGFGDCHHLGADKSRNWGGTAYYGICIQAKTGGDPEDQNTAAQQDAPNQEETGEDPAPGATPQAWADDAPLLRLQYGSSSVYPASRRSFGRGLPTTHRAHAVGGGL